MLGVTIAQDLLLAFGKDSVGNFLLLGLGIFYKLMICVLHSALKWQYYVGRKSGLEKKTVGLEIGRLRLDRLDSFDRLDRMVK